MIVPQPRQIQKSAKLMTCRSGLVCVAQLLEKIGFTALVNHTFPQGRSNRALSASDFITALVMMLHEGGNCLDDVKHLLQDKALRRFLQWRRVPESTTIGRWLRRMGRHPLINEAFRQVNAWLLHSALGRCREVTLDIDATLVKSAKREAEMSYHGVRGYYPLVGTLAETGQVAAVRLRTGGTPPSKDNVAFIHQCQAALPKNVRVKRLRADAASYQKAILNDCFEHDVTFFIRAVMGGDLREFVEQLGGDRWQPLANTDNEEVCDEVWIMDDMQQAFRLVVQRHPWLPRQLELPLDKQAAGKTEQDNEAGAKPVEHLEHQGYVYRAIATNDNEMSMEEVVRCYNARGEHAENRIKELKSDFGGGRLPTGEFTANAVYLQVCMLAYNLFTLLKLATPQCGDSRAKKLRLRVYAVAGVLVQHGRRMLLKVQAESYELLHSIMQRLEQLPLPRYCSPPAPT